MRLGRNTVQELRFDWREALVRAQSVLVEPPAIARIQRPVPKGTLVQRFALPLELCPSTNITRHSQGWKQAKLKKEILGLLQVQARSFGTRSPLPGRPQVLCVRLSSVEPDPYADWAKLAVDKLCAPDGKSRARMGYLRDDRPKDAEVVQWWEPAKQGEGLVYIEIRSGQ
jgi:hypothetical protein